MNKFDIQALITQNRLEEAIAAILALTKNTRHENEIQLLSSQYHENEWQGRLNLQAPADLQRTRNRITHALLQLLDELPDGATIPLPAIQPAPSGTGAGNPPAPPVSGTGNGNSSGGQSGTGDGGTAAGNMKMAFWFAVAVFATLLVITLLNPNWAADNNTLFRTLLALAAAGVVATLPGFLHLNWGNIAKASGAVAAFLLVYLFPPGRESQLISLRVYVEKKNGGWSDLPISTGATVRIIFPSGPKTARVFDGQAEFPGVSPDDLKQPVRIRLEQSDPFAADSTFDLKGKTSANLQVRALGLDLVTGQVFDGKNMPVKGVALTLEGQFDTTDARGLFRFSIPESRQKDRYRLIGTKAGYQDYNNFANPGPSIIPINMPKTRK